MFENITILNRELSAYSLLWLIGVFVCGIYACRLSRRRGLDDNDTIVLLLVSAIGVLLGGHMLYGLTNHQTVMKIVQNYRQIDSFSRFVEAAIAVFGGSVFYGGLLGGLFAGYTYLKKTKRSIPLYAAMLTPVIPLFHVFGRVGCFLSGCCYGVESKVGFVYHHSPLPGANGIVRFPVQLVEAGFNVALFFLLTALEKRERPRKYLLQIYLVLYAVFRFFIEFLRGDALRGIYFSLSTSQIISLAILVIVPAKAYAVWKKETSAAA